MVSRSFTLALAFAVALIGCAGTKHSSSSSSSSDSAASDPPKNQKLDDARRSAEDAELKAHQMREEKNRTATKSGN